LSPNLFLAALGPLTELLGIALILAAFALLRSQAVRRPYFRAWEASWLFLALSLAAGLLYERYVDPESLFYPADPKTTRGLAIAFLALRMISVALVVNGAQLFVGGTKWNWLAKVMVPVAIAVSFLGDTTRVALAPLATLHHPIVALATAYATRLFIQLPPSRRSTGTRYATVAFAAISLLSAALAVFYLVKHFSPHLTEDPWVIRFARYGWYSDLLLQFLLSWAMVRLLIEDGRRESDDIRTHLKLVQDRDKLGELYDDRARLLTRRAFDSMVGLEFARASFGSVVHVRISNFKRVTAEGGIAVGEALVSNLGGVLDSSVRAHDRVYRWGQDELLVILPRAIPGDARARVESLTDRVAPIAMSGRSEPLRAEVALTVRSFLGGEELPGAATSASAA
jgi:diguanylate cyclase (GGDEF)-like protein